MQIGFIFNLQDNLLEAQICTDSGHIFALKKQLLYAEWLKPHAACIAQHLLAESVHAS